MIIIVYLCEGLYKIIGKIYIFDNSKASLIFMRFLTFIFIIYFLSIIFAPLSNAQESPIKTIEKNILLPFPELSKESFPITSNHKEFVNKDYFNLIKLTPPIACTVGKNCWIFNYFDNDPTEKRADYKHGTMSYDNHTGTDFGIATLTQMRKGVNVIASADGIVIAFRDGMNDQFYKHGEEKARIKNMECGNAVILKHSKNLITQYCHMKKGSVIVKRGGTVYRGQKLGEVGLSGKTEFPHVHLSVYYKNKKIDPFANINKHNIKTYKILEENLWKNSPPYNSSVILNAGFSDEKPIKKKAINGDYNKTRFLPSSPKLIFWVDILGIKAGDKLEMQIIDPKGKILVKKNKTISKNKIKYFQFIGKSLKKRTWFNPITWFKANKWKKNSNTDETKLTTKKRTWFNPMTWFKTNKWKKGYYTGKIKLTTKDGKIKKFIKTKNLR